MLLIQSKNHIDIIRKLEILFCKSENCYTTFHLENGKQFIVCKSLNKVTKEIDLPFFIRVHQSYIINTRFLTSIDKKNKQIVLNDNIIIPFTITISDLTVKLLDTSPNYQHL